MELEQHSTIVCEEFKKLGRIHWYCLQGSTSELWEQEEKDSYYGFTFPEKKKRSFLRDLRSINGVRRSNEIKRRCLPGIRPA